MKRNNDAILGLVFVGLGLVVWLALIPVGVEESAFGSFEEAGIVGPKLLPTAVSVTMAVVGGMLFLRATLVEKRRGSPRTFPSVTVEQDRAAASGPVKLVAVSFGYVLLLYLVGYIPSTVLLLAALQWLFGERRRVVLVALPTLLSFGLYFFFRYALFVRLPEGRLSQLLG